jgi:hemerythrin-like domain-containing protein
VEAIAARIGHGTFPEPKDLKDFLGFLKEFADKCHHGKEEGILFPALTRAGIPERGGPIGVMLAEHEEGRRLISEMQGAVEGKVDYARFASAAREYSKLLKSHIEKENNVLFPAAERTLQSGELEKIYAAFEEHEEKVIGQGRHEALHEILKGLKKKYGA